jgi:hypothetical protein
MSLRARHPAALCVAGAILAIALCGPPAAAAKKGKVKVLDVTNAANLTIPGRASPSGPDGLVTSTIDAGKRFKGLRIRDVNVSLQTTGVSGSFPAAGLRPQLTAPNGATVRLFTGLQSLTGAHNIGPLTLDDESPLHLVSLTASDPTALYDPWIGSATPESRRLAVMDDGPARGTWTLTVTQALPNQVSVLNSWGLFVTAGKPYRTK